MLAGPPCSLRSRSGPRDRSRVPGTLRTTVLRWVTAPLNGFGGRRDQERYEPAQVGRRPTRYCAEQADHQRADELPWCATGWGRPPTTELRPARTGRVGLRHRSRSQKGGDQFCSRRFPVNRRARRRHPLVLAAVARHWPVPPDVPPGWDRGRRMEKPKSCSAAGVAVMVLPMIDDPRRPGRVGRGARWNR